MRIGPKVRPGTSIELVSSEQMWCWGSLGHTEAMGKLILRHALRRAIWVILMEHGKLLPHFWMGSGYRNIFVRFEYCASPLCPFDLLPSPEIEGK